MSLFSRFGKRAQSSREYNLSFFPIFSDLTPAQIQLVESKLRLVEVKKGDMAYKKGEAAHAFYLILTGRFRILREDGSVVNHLYPRDYFGETSILTDRAHSATVEAKSDSIVLEIAKEDFLKLLREIPSLGLHLCKTLGRRLTGNLGSEFQEGEAKIISVYHDRSGVGGTTLAHTLAASLHSETHQHVLVIDFRYAVEEGKSWFAKLGNVKAFELSSPSTINTASVEHVIMKSKHGFDLLYVTAEADMPQAERHLAHLLAFLLSKYRYLLIDLPVEMGPLERKALQHSHILYYLSDEKGRDRQSSNAKLEELRDRFAFGDNEIRLLLLESDDARSLTEEAELAEWGTVFPVFAVLPRIGDLEKTDQGKRDPFMTPVRHVRYAKAVRFLAREISGRSVGIALGSGAAFGFAHIGVIKVLEEAGIEVDLIAGSSIGSIIGGMWALGITTQRMVDIVHSIDPKNVFFKLLGFSDLSVAHRGFFKGDQVVRFLNEHLKDATFRDCQIPIKIIAADLATGHPVVFREGPLVTAIRASISIPGIFRPCQWQGKFLIDGGIVDPLPVQTLTRYGAKKVIAVNVLQSPHDHHTRLQIIENKRNQIREDEQNRSELLKFLFEFQKNFLNRQSANIFNVVMKAIQFMEYEMAEASSKQADVTLRPIVSDSHWAEFFSGDKFIMRGEQETHKYLDEIRHVVRA